MAKVCEVCGKKTQTGFNVSHSHRRTKRKLYPNLQNKKLMIDGQVKKVKVCTQCLKTLAKSSNK
jgi:large subunit ribosomal protein L28